MEFQAEFYPTVEYRPLISWLFNIQRIIHLSRLQTLSILRMLIQQPVARTIHSSVVNTYKATFNRGSLISSAPTLVFTPLNSYNHRVSMAHFSTTSRVLSASSSNSSVIDMVLPITTALTIVNTAIFLGVIPLHLVNTIRAYLGNPPIGELTLKHLEVLRDDLKKLDNIQTIPVEIAQLQKDLQPIITAFNSLDVTTIMNLNNLDDTINNLKADFSTNIAAVKGDVASLQANFSTEVTTIKSDVANLQTDVTSLNTTLKDLSNNITQDITKNVTTALTEVLKNQIKSLRIRDFEDQKYNITRATGLTRVVEKLVEGRDDAKALKDDLYKYKESEFNPYNNLGGDKRKVEGKRVGKPINKTTEYSKSESEVTATATDQAKPAVDITADKTLDKEEMVGDPQSTENSLKESPTVKQGVEASPAQPGDSKNGPESSKDLSPPTTPKSLSLTVRD